MSFPSRNPRSRSVPCAAARPGSLVRRARRFLPAGWLRLLPLLLLAACAGRRSRQDADALVQFAEPRLARDLMALSMDLTGEANLDRARLALVEGQEQAARPFAGGWLLQLRRDGQALLVWAGAGAQRGLALRLAAADSLALLDAREDDRPGPKGRHRLLWLERVRDEVGARRALVQGGLRGDRRRLADAPAADARLRGGSAPGWIAADEDAAPGFREKPGSWRLESLRALRKTASGWKLGPAEELDSPYRCLAEFVDAARRGRWRKAARRADLSRLLALPDGGFSRRLGPSLKLDAPELLDGDRLLDAPPFGPLRRFEAVGGRPAWRVETEQLPGEGGRPPSWRIVRLERVVERARD